MGGCMLLWFVIVIVIVFVLWTATFGTSANDGEESESLGDNHQGTIQARSGKDVQRERADRRIRFFLQKKKKSGYVKQTAAVSVLNRFVI